MLIRHINNISNKQIQSTIEFIQLDPQLKFVTFNVPEQHAIFFISLTQFSQQLHYSMAHFHKTKIYSSKLALQPLTKIDTSKNLSKSEVLIIKVAPIWQQRQFMAYATIEHVHIYEIIHNPSSSNDIKVKKQQTIMISHQSPVSALRFHYSALYLGYFNDRIRIYEFDYKKNRWFQSKQLVCMPDEFLRISMYDDELVKNEVPRQSQKTKEKNLVRKYESFQYSQQFLQLKEQKPNFHRMLSYNKLMALKGLQYEYQCSQQSDKQPQAPVLIYQGNDNGLYLAQYDQQQNQYVNTELCEPIKIDYGPIMKNHGSDQFTGENEHAGNFQLLTARKSQIKIKTPRKSNTRILNKLNPFSRSRSKKASQPLNSVQKQKSQKKTSQHLQLSIKQTKNRKSVQMKKEIQMDSFIIYNDEQLDEEINLSDPLMYKMSLCQNYIVQDGLQKYCILSRQAEWNVIHEGIRYPCISPFYDDIEDRVMLQMTFLMGDKLCYEIMNYLSENYEFLLVAFPTSRLQGSKLEPIELFSLSIQLIIVDKLGRMKQENLKSLHKDIFERMNYFKSLNQKKQYQQHEIFNKQVIRLRKNQLQQEKSNKKSNSKSKGKSKSKSKKPLLRMNQNEQQQQLRQEKNESEINYHLRSKFSKKKQPLSIGKQQSERKKSVSFQSQKNTISNKGVVRSNQKQKSQGNRKNQAYTQEPQKIPQNQGLIHTYEFKIFEFQHFKHQPLQIQWISDNELLVVGEEKRLHYVHTHPNILYSTIQKIYLYLYWIQYRDSLDPSTIHSFDRVFDDLEQKERDMFEESSLDESSGFQLSKQQPEQKILQ